MNVTPREIPLALIDQWALWGVAYLPALLEKFALTADDVKQALKHERVKAVLRERQEYWKKGATQEQRIKEKARLSIEDAIPLMQKWLDDEEDVSIPAKLSIIQELGKLAALPTARPDGGQVGAQLVLNVDFGEGRKTSIDSNPVIEQEGYAKLPVTNQLTEE